jgi:hypothetical protein
MPGVVVDETVTSFLLTRADGELQPAASALGLEAICKVAGWAMAERREAVFYLGVGNEGVPS